MNFLFGKKIKFFENGIILLVKKIKKFSKKLFEKATLHLKIVY